MIVIAGLDACGRCCRHQVIFIGFVIGGDVRGGYRGDHFAA